MGMEILKELVTIGLSVFGAVFTVIKYTQAKEYTRRKDEKEKEDAHRKEEAARREREDEREHNRREREEQKDRLHQAEHVALEQTLRKNIHDVANVTSLNGVQIAVLQEQGRFMKEQLEQISRNLNEQSSLLMKIFQQGQQGRP